MLDASRIHKSDEVPDPDSFDLARFISELRGELMTHRTAAPPLAPMPSAPLPPVSVPSVVTDLGNELRAPGRLDVPPPALASGPAFAGPTAETLFGFPVPLGWVKFQLLDFILALYGVWMVMVWIS